MELMKLQNGSDIRGVALENPDGRPVTLTEEACRAIGRGLARWLCREEKRVYRVALGRDCRLSGADLIRWMGEELAAEGMLVTDMGRATTPAMFMSTVTEGYAYDAAVMVTASHLPFERNGYKFFTPAGGLGSADIKTILTLAAEDRPRLLDGGRMEQGSFLDTYAAQLREKIVSATGEAQPFAGLRIVVDAGNGMGGFYADKVLQPLGANTAGSRFLEPDGSFPNHIPNPEDKEAMESITEAVRETGADLGVIFDTDVDRAGAVLSDGSELNRNRLIALLSAILLRENPGTTIVTDSVTSSDLAAFIRKHGGVHRRFKRGYKNVINESVRLNAAGIDSQMAIETSGHGALKENYFLDDGAYLMTKLLIELVRCKKAGEKLEDMLADLAEPVESKEIRMNIAAADFKAYGQSVLDALEKHAAVQPGWTMEAENFEGVRVNLDAEHGGGWFLLRLSLHDPLMPLNIESDLPGGAKRIAAELAPFLTAFAELDSAALQQYAH